MCSTIANTYSMRKKPLHNLLMVYLLWILQEGIHKTLCPQFVCGRGFRGTVVLDSVEDHRVDFEENSRWMSFYRVLLSRNMIWPLKRFVKFNKVLTFSSSIYMCVCVLFVHLCIKFLYLLLHTVWYGSDIGLKKWIVIQYL